MKKKIAALAVIMVTGISLAFANTNNDREKKSAKIKSESRKVRNNEKESSLRQERFVEAGQVRFAFYDRQGSLIAVSRHILSADLPVYLQKELRKDYTNYWITDLFELSDAQESTYYISLENADETLVLQSADGSHWKVFSQLGKSKE